MGPTFSGLLLLEPTAGADWNLYHFGLNPFGQELTKLRAAKPEEVASPSNLMEEEEKQLFESISAPTFLFFGIHGDARDMPLCSGNCVGVLQFRLDRRAWFELMPSRLASLGGKERRALAVLDQPPVRVPIAQNGHLFR